MATTKEVVKEKDMYAYTRGNAPDDLVINVTERPVVIQAEAMEVGRKYSQRIDQGDRRLGEYYVGLVRLGLGLQLVKDIDETRLAELEKIRQIRIGNRPADWILEARRKTASENTEQQVTPALRAQC